MYLRTIQLTLDLAKRSSSTAKAEVLVFLFARGEFLKSHHRPLGLKIEHPLSLMPLIG